MNKCNAIMLMSFLEDFKEFGVVIVDTRLKKEKIFEIGQGYADRDKELIYLILGSEIKP